MKFSTKIFTIGIIFIISTTIFPKQASAQGEVSFQVFYDDLSPYGQWVDYPSYGYVWVPSAGPDFVPYSSGGHWVWSDYGWTWVSDYNWGWAPFHYGRWDYDDYYGWFWLPDNEWGPAWVSWRRSSGYCGWAPLGPHVTVDVSFGGGYVIPNDHWVFVQEQYLGRNDIHNYYGPRKNNSTYINNSTIINNTYIDNSRKTTYVSGPKREEVEKASGRTVRQVAIKESSKPGESLNNNELNIYRPAVVKKEDVRPAKVADKKEVQPVNERKASPQTIQAEKQNSTAPAKRTATENNNSIQKTNRPVQAQLGTNNKPIVTPQNNNKAVQHPSNEKVQRPAVQQQHPQQQRSVPKSQPKTEQPKSQPQINHQPQQRSGQNPVPRPQQQQHTQPAPQHVQPMPHTETQPQQPGQEPVQRPH